MPCDVEFGRDLTFVDADGVCPICCERSPHRMEFPGCPEGHTFCITCVKTSLVGSYENNVAILAEVTSEVNDADEDYDPQAETQRLRDQLGTTKGCPVCHAPTTAPWLLRMQAEGRA